MTQTDETNSLKTKTVEAQTSVTEVTDKCTETLLTKVDLDPDIEKIFAVFCKETLKQERAL